MTEAEVRAALRSPAAQVHVLVAGAAHTAAVDALRERCAPAPEYRDMLYDDLEEPFTWFWFPDASVLRITVDALTPEVVDGLAEGLPEVCARASVVAAVIPAPVVQAPVVQAPAVQAPVVPAGAVRPPQGAGEVIGEPGGARHQGVVVLAPGEEHAIEADLEALAALGDAPPTIVAAVGGVAREIGVGSVDEVLRRNARQRVQVQWRGPGLGEAAPAPVLTVTTVTPDVLAVVLPASAVEGAVLVERFTGLVRRRSDIRYAGLDLDVAPDDRRDVRASAARRWSASPPWGQHAHEWPSPSPPA